MIKIRSAYAAVGATTIEQELLVRDTPEGHSYNYKEIGFDMSDECLVTIYIEDEMMMQYLADSDADVRRVVVNWDVPGGNRLRVTATNNSSGTLDIGAALVYDDVKS